MSWRRASLIRLGQTRYRDALEIQRRLHAMRVSNEIEDTLVLTEHQRVLTLGRRADERHLRVPVASLAQRNIELVRVERGGDVTYHGPGQLVAYPIVDLRRGGVDVHLYVRRLEETALRLLRTYGLEGLRLAGTPGVWVGDRKIASVGVYVSHWVTMHGVAINIAPDLEDFDLIHPCGLVGTSMTSVAALTGNAPSIDRAMGDYASTFATVFQVSLTEVALPQDGADSLPRPIAPAGRESVEAATPRPRLGRSAQRRR